MDELLALLREIEASEDIELADGLVDLAEQFGRRNDDGATPLDDDQLKALIDGLVALGVHDDVSGELIGLAADVAVEARGERDALAERLEAEEAARQEQLARLRGEDPSAEDETPTEPAGDEPEGGDDEGDEPDEGGDDRADEPAGEAPADASAEASAEPVAAAAAPARRPAARRALRRRTPAEAKPREVQASPGFRITLGADLPGIAAGSEANGLAAVDKALVARAQSFQRSNSRALEKVHVATIKRDPLDEDRRLVDNKGRILAPHEASERVQRTLSTAIAAARADNGGRALVAAGGLCAPVQPIYAVEVLGETGRPVRDTALVSFQATRGGVVSTAPPTIASVTGAIGTWTVADDEEALNNDGGVDDVTKPELRVECGAHRTSHIEAFTRRLIVGNLLAMTYGEYVDAVSTAAMVAQDRHAEQRILARMRNLSTITDAEASQVSATVDVLDVLSRAAWGIRSRHRLSRTFPMRVVLPEILLPVMQTDLSRRMPAGTVAENLAVSEQVLARFFAERSMNVTWSPDMNVQGAQAAGPLAEWPDSFEWLVYPEGTFVHLDSGELDLGTYRDHRLNDVNDAAVFAETFEGVHFLGTESVAGTSLVCPSGGTVGTIDPAEVCGANS